ncbi:MAG TPA: ice-binding family protein, partial [Nocardioidaceae bacterium]|nr:ice-binding family protein [Nocardioidaceae bacterium]
MVAVLVAVVLGASPAAAYWTSTGSTSGSAQTGTLAAPVDVTVPDTATADVPVTWSAGVGGVEPSGYYVTRHSGGTTSAACSSSPASLVEATDCVDAGVPDGEHTYVVTAVFRTWTATSLPSNLVTVTAVTPLLGAAGSYSVLAGTAVVSTGVSSLSGNLGVSPAGAITGFPPGTVGGDIHASDAHAAAAQDALLDAYNYLSGLTPTANIAGDLGGRTVTSGIYYSAAALALTGILTLDAQGDPNAIFIFQVGAAVNTAAASSMNLINGARASNVFWVVLGATTAGASSFFSGTILTLAAVTLGAGTELIGSALSRAAVTLDSNVIRFTASLPPTMTIDGGPTAVTKDTTPTITGTSNAPILSPVTVSVNGQTLTTTVTVGGTWSVTSAALLASTYGVVAKVRDPSGNWATATQALTVEVNPAPVLLGNAAGYAVLAGTVVTSTGATSVTGDLGVSPGILVTGFPPGTLVGTLHSGDQPAADAQVDLAAALVDATSRAPHTEIVGDLGGKTFH